MKREPSSSRPARRWSADWTVIGVGIGLAGLIITQIGGLRSDHREDIAQVRGEIMQVRQEIMNLRDAVVANGKVLARIEQALFGPPAKVTPADQQ